MAKNDDDELKIKEQELNTKQDDLWEMLRNKENEGTKNWEKRMVTAEYAYHVTSIPVKENEDKKYKELKWHLANDLKYDRQLVGLPCVFFSTTLYKNTFNDGLPDQSPYPANGEKGHKYWRVRVPLDRFKEYRIWYCKHPFQYNSKYQVRLILTKDDGEAKYIKDIPDIIEVEKEKKNPFLYYNNDEKKWYTNSYYTADIRGHIDYKINYIVNFVVLKNVSLELKDEIWDTVLRSTVGRGEPLGPNLLAAAVIRKWSAYRKNTQSIEEEMKNLDLNGRSNPKESK